jgi:hypothetical protein
MTQVVEGAVGLSDPGMIRPAVQAFAGRGEPDVREFADEVVVLSRWLGRDITADLGGVVPVWSAFRFRDAAVFEPEASGGAGRMYLVRGESVREFLLSRVTIDEAYARLSESDPLPAVA